MTVVVGAIEPWPPLPVDLAALLDHIAAEDETSPRNVRPWDLSRLPQRLVDPVWGWLEDVVQWINRHHAWQPQHVIPPCWPQHPNVALELAVLAFARQIALRAVVPTDLEQWHRDLAAFHLRLAQSIGEVTLRECQRGRHNGRPSTYELDVYSRPPTVAQAGES